MPYPSRKKDYHRNKKDRHRNKKNFVIAGIDGEAVRYEDKSYYVYLAIFNRKPLVAGEIRNLTTKEIFEYILSIPKYYRLVGFVLNYDVENWLRDVPNDAYLWLTGKMFVQPKEAGKEKVINLPADDSTWKPFIREHKKGIYKGKKSYVKNTIIWDDYKIFWIPKKIFTLQNFKTGRSVRILDIWGYCQASFIKAIKNWKVASEEELEVIEQGKMSREVFSWEELTEIEKYNKMELKLLTALAYKVLNSSRKALDLLKLNIKVNYNSLYGPGALSAKILKKLKWPEKIGRYIIPDKLWEDFLVSFPQKVYIENGVDNKQKEYLLNLPFIASYYGGRIECSGVGYWGKVFDYDINSAYPAAITKMPSFNLENCIYIPEISGNMQNELLNKRFAGMYYISWNFGKQYYWNPFPFRTERGNVFYPPSGEGWVCSPEIFAAYDTGFYFKLHKAVIIQETEGFGGGEKKLPENRKTVICRIIEKMYKERKRIKNEEGKGGAELALKLILNSMYGKLLQQVGRNLEKLGAFNDFVATWITSWTRAQIWRAIARYSHTKSVLAVMTDGIVTTKEIEGLAIGTNLGEWEMEVYKNYLQLLPGLYRMTDIEGNIIEKTRGMPKGFDFEKARKSLYTKEIYRYKYRIFVGRRIWLSQHFALKKYLYQWPEMVKEYKPDLSSKRREYDNSLVYLNEKHKYIKHKYIKPKSYYSIENFTSFPFSLAFEDYYWVPESKEELENVILEELVTDYGNYFRE